VHNLTTEGLDMAKKKNLKKGKKLSGAKTLCGPGWNTCTGGRCPGA